MPDYPWYSLANDTGIQQGDIFQDYPLLLPSQVSVDEQSGVGSVSAEILLNTVVVLSQSCDLVDDSLSTVIVCPAFHFDVSLKNQGLEPSKSLFGHVRKGYRPAYHLLNPCNIVGQSFPHLLLNFGQVSVTHRSLLLSVAESSPDRIRLNPPYREQLSQAFARFVMRVGLPTDIDPLPE